MSSPQEPLTRQQRFALRAICIAGSLLALLSIVSLTFLRSEGTTRGLVGDILLMVCGVALATVSGR